MSRATISAVIITKNEENKIGRCLESIRWVDEIIIVDDMSTDKTVEICQSYGAKVIRNKSEGNFDGQRNMGIDKARGEWILQLDADEIVPENLRREIELRLRSNNSKVNAYQFKRKNYFLGHFMQYGGWYNYAAKLFRKGTARYVGHSVHETLQVDGKIETIEADIYHYPYQSLLQVIERTNQYTDIEAKVLLEKYGRPNQRTIIYQLTWRPVKIFWKAYLKKRGYRDRMYGLIFAIISAFSHFLKWAKLWELLNAERTNDSRDTI